jgi:hypothetical protein
MNGRWLQYTTLRVASLLVPSDRRAEWIEEWRSELWYIQCRATIFCMGAFRDAFWLRRNHGVPVKRTRIRLESPLSCLALLATLAAVSIFFALHVLARHIEPARLKAPNLAGIWLPVQMLSCLLLPALLWVWMPPASRYSVSRSSTLRRGIFLTLKIALLQSMVLCGSLCMALVQIFLGPGCALLTGIAGTMIVALAARWAITDQQRRCPVCLRLLTNPITIGTPSRTFLEWYGVESTCPQGHGLLHTSETSSSYSRPQWLGLDDSWSDLFASGAGRRS